MQAQLEKLFGRLEGVRTCGKGKWQAKCPAHDDRLPSLAISEAQDKILIHCFAGCSPTDVLDAVGLELGDLFEGSISNGHGHTINWAARVKRARFALSLIAIYAGTIEKNWDAVATVLNLDEEDQAIFWGAFQDVKRLLDG
jgi:hypothetical protein